MMKPEYWIKRGDARVTHMTSISDITVDRIVHILKATPIRELLLFEEVVGADWPERVI
jgi:hypothetical protein